MKYPVLITSIYDSPEMLRWFLPHYQRLGVREFHIAVYLNQQLDLVDVAREQSKNYPVRLHLFESRTIAAFKNMKTTAYSSKSQTTT